MIPEVFHDGLLFLSTLSLRRATWPAYLQRQIEFISIHALLAESDEQKCGDGKADVNFYPRSPCGERPPYKNDGGPGGQFLSTLSLRRATDNLQVPASVSKISIHALLAESDHPEPDRCPGDSHFYPRSPCGERQRCQASDISDKRISIHALLAESDWLFRPLCS